MRPKLERLPRLKCYRKFGGARMNVRQLRMATRSDLARAVSERHASSSRAEKSAILNEFTAVTGFPRKHAVRVVRGVGDAQARRRPRPTLYGEAAREAMLML